MSKYFIHQSKAANRTQNAFGLLEVVISIAISGVILLGSMNVALKGLQVVRLNEIKDIANGILLRSLEFARSPSSDLNLTELIQNGANTYSFAINANPLSTDPKKQASSDLLKLISSANDPKITTCGDPSTADYLVAVGNKNDNAPFQICNQIQIKKLTAPATALQNDFSIVSTVIYVYNNQQVSDSLVSYRSELKPTTP